mmetsp:Transcript_85909/g.224173  ORF Transcript_85909/g.224173 Transcript_85909/m.224173 type:complete len:243 (-) Transcript_85909:309-1037(-)
MPRLLRLDAAGLCRRLLRLGPLRLGLLRQRLLRLGLLWLRLRRHATAGGAGMEADGLDLVRLLASVRGVRGADVAVHDVVIRYGGVWVLRADVRGRASCLLAGAARDSRGGPVTLAHLGIKPQHLALVVVPQGQHERHATSQRLARLLQGLLLPEVIGVIERFLLGRAEIIGDRIAAVFPKDGGIGILNHLATLHIQPPDLYQISIIGAIVGDELSNYSHRLFGVHGVLWPGSKKILRAHAV